MIKMFRQSKSAIYMIFDNAGNEQLISAFTALSHKETYKLNVNFDLSIINMKKTNFVEISLVLRIDNNIERSLIQRIDDEIIWIMDYDDADYGLGAFNDCKENGSFFRLNLSGFKYSKIEI
ncbi:MAG: hypothetical protein Q4D76_18835 [Oscillospiraceae bacterium]|nr:hypothetical protein [Oscillospiraceae bacterium]